MGGGQKDQVELSQLLKIDGVETTVPRQVREERGHGRAGLCVSRYNLDPHVWVAIEQAEQFDSAVPGTANDPNLWHGAPAFAFDTDPTRQPPVGNDTVCTLPQESWALWRQVRARVALMPTYQSASALATAEA